MDVGRRRGRRAPAFLALLAVLAGTALASGATARAPRAGVSTRADLDLLRRRVALLESELALARSRKPYLVVDAATKHLRFALLGMTLREIAATSIRIDGLRRAGQERVSGPLSLAGIVTLAAKDKDPRLEPLTPEQIEAGAADENVADALPPEAPADFGVRFKQPIALRVLGVPQKTTSWSRLSGWWSRPWRRGGSGELGLRVTVHLDETAARELYRALIPGARLVLVPPAGFLLPDAGQEAPRGVRPGRPARPPSAQPGPAAQGVPFRIPPPVGEGPADGATPADEGAPPGDDGGPAAEDAPAQPAATPERPVPGDPPAPSASPEDPPGVGGSAPAPGAGGGA
jgi:hypothetical protein